MRHLITVDDLTPRMLESIFVLADSFRNGRTSEYGKRRLLANLFYEPSTRTSSSFYAAMHRLGGSVLPINDVTFSSVSKGEVLEDTIRTLGCYADIIVLRHHEVGAAARAAAVSDVPIINAGDGSGEHPTQALLDLYTILTETDSTNGLPDLEGLEVTLMGDLKHGRTVHSLVKLLRPLGVKLTFVSPPELRMPAEYMRSEDAVLNSLQGVIRTTDILYMTRVQKERFTSVVGEADISYGITVEDMAVAKPTMRLLHPFPRVNEIPFEIDQDPRAAYFRQMQNGLYVRMALIEILFQAEQTRRIQEAERSLK